MGPAIEIDRLSKQYRLGIREEMPDTMMQRIFGILSSPLRNYRNLRRLSETSDDREKGVLWALRDVSVTIERGEVMGVIGANGAGKSTLLKILAKITSPTSGEARIRGRVGSLLEVGTGFHPELTGRENVYLNGTLLGMSKREVEQRFDEIVAFSELEDFVDTPVKRYSSGMRVRLAFSVAAHLEPEILLVDEVLAVGDLKFQQKSLGKIKDVSTHGRTVVFVSHQLSMITQLCERCILLDRGRVSFVGDVSEAVARYSLSATQSDEAEKESSLSKVWIRRINGLSTAELDSIPNDREICIELGVTLENRQEEVLIILLLEDAQGRLVIHHSFSGVTLDHGSNEFRIVIPALRLLPGVYGVYFKVFPNRNLTGRSWRMISVVYPVSFAGNVQQYGKVPPLLSLDITGEVLAR